MKILLLVIICTFFTPFISVSCTVVNAEIGFSGFDMAFGKDTEIMPIDGNAAAIILIIPSVVLLILEFTKLPLFVSYIAYITTAVLNCVMAFGLRIAIYNKLNEMINSNEFGSYLNSSFEINMKYGFVLYIAFSAVLLVVGFTFFLAERKK